MKILLIEPYFTGSHKSWAEGYQQYSEHDVEILSMSGHYWKWRMHGGAVTLAKKYMEGNYAPDLILTTDMLDLTIFQSLTNERTYNIPTAIYFHENQITYPWSPTDRDIEHKRDHHYGFINYTSALAADKVFFNSTYHMNSFLQELPKFLKGFPDHTNLDSVETIQAKSEVLHLGMNFERIDNATFAKEEKPRRAVILWNHRWEYDKNPEDFFSALFELQEVRGIDFRLVVLGENFSKQPKVFEKAREDFKDKILHFGYAEDFNEYVKWVKQADILPVTSHHDFFGASVVQAMHCNVIPLLPDRLAYPEHIPEQFHNVFFYKDRKHFLKKLHHLIMDVRVIRKQSVKQYVEQYDWRKMAPHYDAEFSQLSQ